MLAAVPGKPGPIPVPDIQEQAVGRRATLSVRAGDRGRKHRHSCIATPRRASGVAVSAEAMWLFALAAIAVAGALFLGSTWYAEFNDPVRPCNTAEHLAQPVTVAGTPPRPAPPSPLLGPALPPSLRQSQTNVHALGYDYAGSTAHVWQATNEELRLQSPPTPRRGRRFEGRPSRWRDDLAHTHADWRRM